MRSAMDLKHSNASNPFFMVFNPPRWPIVRQPHEYGGLPNYCQAAAPVIQSMVRQSSGTPPTGVPLTASNSHKMLMGFDAALCIKTIAERIGCFIMLMAILLIRLTVSSEGKARVMGNTHVKRLKRPSSFEIEPIYFGYRSWKSTRNTSWAWARDWWVQTRHTPTLRITYHTYA